MVERRVAVLVDGDNVGAGHAGRILEEAAALGRIDVARAYVGDQPRSSWLTAAGYWAVQIGPGKNAVDLILSIDAMELGLVDGIEAFAIATSDRDFTYLAHRLRGRGLHVLGLGEQKAPECFRRACSAFHDLCSAERAALPPTDPVSSLDNLIRSLLAESGGCMRLQELGARMYSLHGIRKSDLPEQAWRSYLSARPALYRVDLSGSEPMVRAVAAAFA